MLPLLDFDRTAIESAIKAAELRTTGEIRVFIERRKQKDTTARAAAIFHELGMENTANRNGVLLYVHLRQKELVILGDEGINAKVGSAFWHHVCATVLPCFARKEMTVGVVLGIMLAAEPLAHFFPCDGNVRNELPDGVVEGK